MKSRKKESNVNKKLIYFHLTLSYFLPFFLIFLFFSEPNKNIEIQILYPQISN